MAGRYTFWKLLSEREIEIPVIQRDYAQGRKTAGTIRTEFLASIKKALINREPLDMNFVYGSIEDKKQFVPIDGQQRLTTLFLLHLYLIHAAGRNPADYEQLRKFRYTTRMTSTYFCTEIIRNRIEDPEGRTFREIRSLRKAIVDNSWFGTSWQNDPTVDAMLNMLEDMHKAFRDTEDLEELLDLLMDEDNCPLYFYYLDLGEYHLEDSIYIKMNARGKALTDYENFKARLERFLTEKNVPNRDEMAGSLDREWTDFFWSIVSAEDKADGKDIRFDDRMMNFIVAWVCNDVACHTVLTKRADLRREMSELLSLSRIQFAREFEHFDRYFINPDDPDQHEKTHETEKSFTDMFRAFSLMVKDKKNIEYAPDIPFFDEKKIFMNVLEDNPGYDDRARFYVYSQYLLYHEDHIVVDDLTEWMRIVEHLIGGQHFVGPDEYVHVIKGFHWLAENSTDILKFLSTYDLQADNDADSEETDDKRPYFNIYIFREECLKARLMLLSDEWKHSVKATESNAYLNGQIYSVLEFAGITDEQVPVAEWDADMQQKYLEAFRHYSEIFNTLFTAEGDRPGVPGLDRKIGNVFRRALLTKGDFTIKAGQNMSFLVNEIIGADCSWKRLLRPQKDKNLISKRGYMRALFDDARFDISNVTAGCEAIIADYHCTDPEYRYFIEIPEVMAFVIGERVSGKSKTCQNFFRNHDNTKFLLWTTQLNGYCYDYYKYALYWTLKKELGADVKYDSRSSVEEVNREPVTVRLSDDVYRINYIRGTKQYQITDDKGNTDVIKDSLEETVQYVRDTVMVTDGSSDSDQG